MPLQVCAHCKKNIAFVLSGKQKEDSEQSKAQAVSSVHKTGRHLMLCKMLIHQQYLDTLF
jgi:hypothetical protein